MLTIRTRWVFAVAGGLAMALCQPVSVFASVATGAVTTADLAPAGTIIFPGFVGLLALTTWALLHAQGQDEASIRARSAGSWDWVEQPAWPMQLGETHNWMIVLPDGSVLESGANVTLGTASDNDVVLSDPSVLPHHAKLRWYGTDLLFTNLGGCQSWVGGRSVRGSMLLHRGTVIRLGRTELTVHRDVSGLAGDRAHCA
jgi:hypothetical protein